MAAAVVRRCVSFPVALRRRFIYENTNSRIISSTHCRCFTSRLAEVGLLETPRERGRAYETGQDFFLQISRRQVIPEEDWRAHRQKRCTDNNKDELFLHKVFGYRGIVLFPWLARVYDRDAGTKSEEKPPEDDTTVVGKEVKGRTHLYYLVLVDSRDCPYIRAQTEAVTFLGNQENSRALYAISGLDYLAHNDILPYSTNERHPIHHELFNKFLMHDPGGSPAFIARDTLRAWQEKNHPWLQLSDVHREITENIRVTVIPFYIGSRESQQTHVFWWRYCVRLENLGDDTVQLRERHWRIFSLSGTLETVRGRGVVGQEPILSKEQPAFQYSSHVSLQAPSGHMWGTYKMERRDGTSFECRIPPFSLESKSDDANNPHGLLGS